MKINPLNNQPLNNWQQPVYNSNPMTNYQQAPIQPNSTSFNQFSSLSNQQPTWRSNPASNNSQSVNGETLSNHLWN